VKATPLSSWRLFILKKTKLLTNQEDFVFNGQLISCAKGSQLHPGAAKRKKKYAVPERGGKVLEAAMAVVVVGRRRACSVSGSCRSVRGTRVRCR